MALTKYESNYTGQQIDDAVGLVEEAVTNGGIATKNELVASVRVVDAETGDVPSVEPPVGIVDVEAGTPVVSGNTTSTPITFTYGKNETKTTVDVVATNGSTGAIQCVCGEVALGTRFAIQYKAGELTNGQTVTALLTQDYTGMGGTFKKGDIITGQYSSSAPEAVLIGNNTVLGNIAGPEGAGTTGITITPASATQGTLTADQWSVLQANDLNYISLNYEIYHLMDKNITGGYTIYTHVGQTLENRVFIKTINITNSGLSWVLQTYEIPQQMYTHNILVELSDTVPRDRGFFLFSFRNNVSTPYNSLESLATVLYNIIKPKEFYIPCSGRIMVGSVLFNPCMIDGYNPLYFSIYGYKETDSATKLNITSYLSNSSNILPYGNVRDSVTS